MEKDKLIKVAVIAVCVIVVVIIAWRLGRKIYDKIQSNRTARGLSGSIDPKNLSYDIPQYEVFAKSLNTAMNRWGTDEDAIQNVFNQMNTRDDVLKLQAVFGVVEGRTLGEWLADELSASDMDKYVNGVLRAKSISYSF